MPGSIRVVVPMSHKNRGQNALTVLGDSFLVSAQLVLKSALGIRQAWGDGFLGSFLRNRKVPNWLQMDGSSVDSPG